MPLIPKRRKVDNDRLYDHSVTSFMRPDVRSISSVVRWKQLVFILLWFTCIVHYFERIKPRAVLKACLWDQWEDWPEGSDPHHSFIYGDPQLVDNYSYPKRSRIGMMFTKWISDNYLHRNHQIINSVLKPDSCLFIGDLFDGGREWENNEWYDEYKRFVKIFNPIEGMRQYKQLPGNHDIGFGTGIHFDKYSRFRSYFGEADTYVTLGNHSVVLLDTVSLSCTNDTRVNMNSQNFLEAFNDPYYEARKLPRILLSHVPLYRFTERQTCGPLRESKKSFPVAKGTQYQTVLEFELSQKIINVISPSVIFSGDDHDYCHIRHPLNKYMSRMTDDYIIKDDMQPGLNYADEITIKSSAMTGGIKKPAIQLMSLWNPTEERNDHQWKINQEEVEVVDSQTIKSKVCYLPQPFKPLIHYAMTFTVSLLWLFFCTVTVAIGERGNRMLNYHLRKLQNKFVIHYQRQEIDLDDIGKEHDRFFDTAFKSIFMNWNIEKKRNWKAFAINAALVFVGYFFIIYMYFTSI